jgi:hypothetical protein
MGHWFPVVSPECFLEGPGFLHPECLLELVLYRSEWAAEVLFLVWKRL